MSTNYRDVHIGFYWLSDFRVCGFGVLGFRVSGRRGVGFHGLRESKAHGI